MVKVKAEDLFILFRISENKQQACVFKLKTL